MKRINLIILSCFVLSISCADKANQEELPDIADFEVTEVVSAKEHIETVCYVCHSPTAAPDDRLAPPLEIAKRNYLAKTDSREEFVDKMVQFILMPTAEQAMLHSDVEQYGIMDPVGFSEQDVREIVEYIYDNKLEKPSWLKDQ